MYLSALTVGYAVPHHGFEAAVHSVFQSAANLRLTKSGKLLTLVGSGEAALPQGICLDTSTDFSFTILRAGEPVTCRNGLLHIDSISLTIDLTRTRIWKCDLPTLRTDLTNTAVESAWKAVWQALNRRQRDNGADIVAEALVGRIGNSPYTIPQKASQATQALIQATKQFNLTAASPIRELIGLGPGLTPAGDDILAGYLAGLWCTTFGKSEREAFVSGLGRKIVQLSHRTNDISRTYLYHAARGQVSSHIASLAEAISQGESDKRLLDITENAMRVGHTSGMDAVTGLLLGLVVWKRA